MAATLLPNKKPKLREVILISPSWTCKWLSFVCGIPHFHGGFCSCYTKKKFIILTSQLLVDKAITILEELRYILLVGGTSTWLNSFTDSKGSGRQGLSPMRRQLITNALYIAKLQKEKGASKKMYAGLGAGLIPLLYYWKPSQTCTPFFQNSDYCQRLLAFRITLLTQCIYPLGRDSL